VSVITDADIKNLKGTFATKEDLQGLEERLEEKFVTKPEFRRLEAKVDGIQEEVGDLKVEFAEFREKLDGLDVKFDAMLGLLTDSMEEHRSGAAHFARHDRQIAALATATGTALPD
jgi:predicted nuclease with TOPRIM domain